jgi:hypothetical protein
MLKKCELHGLSMTQTAAIAGCHTSSHTHSSSCSSRGHTAHLLLIFLSCLLAAPALVLLLPLRWCCKALTLWLAALAVLACAVLPFLVLLKVMAAGEAQVSG